MAAPARTRFSSPVSSLASLSLSTRPSIRFSNSPQRRPLGADPEVHRVGHGERRPGALLEHLHLQLRRAVGQEQELAAAVTLGQDRIELGQHVQLHVERLAVVHVRQVLAPPAEGLAAGHDLQARGVDVPRPGACACAPAGQSSPTTPTSRTVVKIAGGIGEEHGRAAQHVVALLAGRFDAVQGHGTDDHKRHDDTPLGAGKPWRARRPLRARCDSNIRLLWASGRGWQVAGALRTVARFGSRAVSRQDNHIMGGKDPKR